MPNAANVPVQRVAVVVVVVGGEPLVGGEDGVDDVGELELDGRQVVQRAQHHAQQVPGRLDALLGDPARVQAVAVRRAAARAGPPTS